MEKVTAKCIMECFDGEKHYYPGDEDEIDLNSDVATCFALSTEDRKTALDLTEKRSKMRKAELTEMKKQGFENIFQFRQFKTLNACALPAD